MQMQTPREPYNAHGKVRAIPLFSKKVAANDD